MTLASARIAELDGQTLDESTKRLAPRPLPILKADVLSSGNPAGCVTASRNTNRMGSSKTQAVAARIPNHLAARIRQQAQQSGVTVSDIVTSCIVRSLGESQERDTDDNAHLKAVR